MNFLCCACCCPKKVRQREDASIEASDLPQGPIPTRLPPLTPDMWQYQNGNRSRGSVRLKGVPMIHIPRQDRRPLPRFDDVPGGSD